MPTIACHGGSASNPEDEDGPQRACLTGLDVMVRRGGALEAAVAATVQLEDDERFNAGTGSNLRFDGKTIQMDAACMTSGGAFGAVAVIEGVKNPIRVAREVLDTPHVLIAGDGATSFARRAGFARYDPTTRRAEERHQRVLAATAGLGEWTRADLERAWNFETPLRQAIGGDTVGSVAWDGEVFAAALSSGGTTTVLRGRVGDVPLPGCGLFVGARGAIAATGDGEHLARSLLAYRAYAQLERGRAPQEVVAWALGQLGDEIDVGLVVINEIGFAGGARNGMAWQGRCVEAA